MINLPTMISNFGKVLKGTGGKVLLIGRKHAPEIFIGLGITGFVGTVAATVHATNQTRDILDEKNEFEKTCEKCLSLEDESYTRVNYENDLKIIKRKTRKKLLKTWWPVGTLGAGSVISVLGGYKVLNGRYVATAAAYKTLEAGYERYRENVIAKYGPEADAELREIKAEEVEKELKRQEELQKAEDKDGKKKKKKLLPQGNDLVIFDENSDRWRRYWTPDMVLDYLQIKENECNDKRMLTGHIFVNEIRDTLGVKRTSDGAVLGYINKPVSFGLFDGTEAAEKRCRTILSVVRNGDIHVPIRLEPEGLIFDKI